MKKENKVRLLALLLGTLCLLAACKPSAQPGIQLGISSTQGPGAPVDISSLNASNYPVVDGSTATLPLMAQVYSRVCGVIYEEAERKVTASKTAAAWQMLAEGSVDLLLVYEAPEETKEWLQTEGIDLEIHAIGRDGLVFITNEQNPVESLTQKQLKDIYKGKITNWKTVGGSNQPISAFQRNAESGSQSLFLKLVMQGEEPMEPPTHLLVAGMGGLIESLASYDDSASAIGYSVFYYASEMYEKPGLKFVGVDGVLPQNSTIADKTYPLTNDFYVAIRADEPEGSPARILRNWLLSAEGIQALEEAGYVSAIV